MAMTSAPSRASTSAATVDGGAVGAVDHDAQAVEVGGPRARRPDGRRSARRRVGLGRRAAPPRGRSGGGGGAVGIERPRRRARPRWRPRRRSGSLAPPAAKSLMPLSAKGLCDAEITAAGHARAAADRQATPGVGSTPRSTTSAPSLASPADKAAWSRGPERRVSRPTRKRRRPAGRGPRPARAPGPARRVSSALATPRTPSVPNRAGATTGYRLEYCGALRAFFRPYFLRLLLAGVAGEEARPS